MTTETTEDRCSGHCCRRFPLPKTPAMLAELAVAAKQRAEKGRASRIDLDLLTIAAMAILVGTEAEADVARRHGFADGRTGTAVDGVVYYYTCRNLLPNGDCGIYEFRPTMCREFPYGQPCEYAGKGCTSSAACAGTIGRAPMRWGSTTSLTYSTLARVIEGGDAWR